MKTFFSIIQQLLKSDTYDSNSPNIFFQIFANTTYTTKLKFDFYNKTNKNPFLNDMTKQRFNDMFYKIQRTYFAFNRLKNVFLYKCAKLNANTDMELNEIVEGGKNVICLHHKNGKYLFKINDLLKIINNSLTNSHYFFSEPIAIKNPYNNLPFDKSNLYNIYFFIKFNTRYKADLFEKYFNVNFNLSEFYHQYEFLLREYIIKNYVNDSTKTQLRKHIHNMLADFNKLHVTMKFKIDAEFPDDTLITIMKPYVLLYITSLYSLVAIIKTNAFAKLKCKLTQFYKFNPAFGRKTAVINYSQINVSSHIDLGINITKNPKPYITKYIFNDKHIDYFKTENDTFFENHKTLKWLYNLDYLRITIGQGVTNANANVYLIADDSVDDTSDSDDDNAYDNADTDDDADDDADADADNNADADADNNADNNAHADADAEADADADADNNMDTEDDNIQYEYTYEYNYEYNYGT